MVIKYIIIIYYCFGMATNLYASEGSSPPSSFIIHNLWIIMASALVFMMHLGFASLEAGFAQSKSTTSILFKNIAVVSIGVMSYYFIGFSLMYPNESIINGVLGFNGFGIDPGATGQSFEYNNTYTYYTDFIFQALFAATAATIVSGAVAERIKLGGFLIFTTLLSGIFYPIIGMWKWGGGFLDSMTTPFHDFAGSTIVHSVGGWAALWGAIILGPRIGKYINGKPKTLRPSNLPLATTGIFLLWFGWYGFNGGSVLSAEPALLSLVFVNTTFGACCGLITAMLLSWAIIKRPDISNALNGALAGLVAITAGADIFSPAESVFVGIIGGIIVVTVTRLLDFKLKIDDPVGAIPVHLGCGIWGTLAVGLFGEKAGIEQTMSQLIGIAIIGFTMSSLSIAAFSLLKYFKLLRVSVECEKIGLDVDHYTEAYGIDSNSIIQAENIDTNQSLAEAEVKN